MLSAIVVVAIPSAVALAGFLCYREGQEKGYREGWEDGNHYTPVGEK